MPKRVYAPEPYESAFLVTKRRRTGNTVAMPVKRSTYIRRRRPFKRTIRRRRIAYKTRRPRYNLKKRRRKTGGFAHRVLKATSPVDRVTYNGTGTIFGEVGRARWFFSPMCHENGIHAQIQNKIAVDSDTITPTNDIEYYLESSKQILEFNNARAGKVHAYIYYFKARRDTPSAPEQLYTAGMEQHAGSVLPTSTQSTLFMSNDFVTHFKIIKQKHMILEQGESFKTYLKYGPTKIKSDIFANTTVRGTYGVAIKFVGDLGVTRQTIEGNISDTVTTIDTSIMFRNTSFATFRRLTDDNSTTSRIGNDLATASKESMRFANSDTGVAIAGRDEDVTLQ